MSPKFLKRLKRFPAHYPSGPGMACFTLNDFTQIQALLFELDHGAQLQLYIAQSKERAALDSPDHELTSIYPLRIPDLPPNPYGAEVAICSLSLFINRHIDVDGFLLLCLPQPALEMNAALICGAVFTGFSAVYSHQKTELTFMEMPGASSSSN